MLMTSSMDGLKVIQGQRQTIRCEVTGTPIPKIEWLKNEKPLNATVDQTSTNLHYIHIRFPLDFNPNLYTTNIEGQTNFN